MKHLFCFLLASILCGHFVASAETDTTSSPFTQGQAAYETGDFSSAREHFEKALSIEELPATRHNLALSYFQLGQPAEAVWQLERAHLLAPFNKDYIFKLGALREELGLPAKAPKWYELAGNFLSFNGWLLVATIAFWLLIAALLGPCLTRTGAGLGAKFVRFACVLILILAVPALWLHFQTRQSAVVVSAESATLRAAPASAAPQSGSARPGERARIIDRHQDFLEIETETGATGWVNNERIRRLVKG